MNPETRGVSEAEVGGGEYSAECSTRLQFLHSNQDLQSNWEVDLAKNLEEYLLRICSGEIQDHELHSVNFAEAALLVQGSAQVYSRKVEYLYSLVLQALEFVTQKRQEQTEKPSEHGDGTGTSSVSGDESEAFLGLDAVPVEANNCLDAELDRSEAIKHFVKPPANLLVLEGDCLETSGEGSDLESYLLASCNFYGDFLLLDPCDAGSVFDFLKTNAANLENHSVRRGSSMRSKSRRASLLSPFPRSGGCSQKSHRGKFGDGGLSQAVQSPHDKDNPHPSLHVEHEFGGPGMDNIDEFDIECPDPNIDSDDSDEDPWKPLNPHEAGNLKMRPFRKVKGFGRQTLPHSKGKTVDSEFPIARLDHFISPELAKSLEVQNLLKKKTHGSKLPLFEKLRKTLAGEQEPSHGIRVDNDDEDDGMFADHVPDCSQEDFDFAEPMFDMDAELPLNNPKPDEVILEGDDLAANENLEDLCCSHLDALLASIAETENQTELAARVSTWKQRVEHSLEEQDAHPPFDIKEYGDKVIDKLSVEENSGQSMVFSDIVMGQAKHDISRTFSALLQLVNDGTVDIERAPIRSELVCHTAANPFFVRLIGPRRQDIEKNSARKRIVNSPLRKRFKKRSDNFSAISHEKSSLRNGRVQMNLGKGSMIRCTPDRKRRRKTSRLTDQFDVESTS